MSRKISSGTKIKLNDFLLASRFDNGRCSDQIAWEQFYDLARHTHKYRANLSYDDLKEILVELGVNQDIADELSTVYQHCRNILYKKKQGERYDTYPLLIGQNRKKST